MEFNYRGRNAQMQHMYHSPVKEGLWSGASLGGGQGGLGIYPGSVDTREAIQRELWKEKIREEIVAEEIARKRVLEAEVRREMAMEKAMHGGWGFPSSFMLKPPLSHTNRLEPGEPRGQPFSPVSFEEMYGRQRREIGSFQMVPTSPGDGKKKVIDLGKPSGATPSGEKGKPPSSAAAGSSEWSCAVCKVSAPCENGFKQHLAGKKHQAQVAIMKVNKAQKHGQQQKTCKKQSPSPSISGDGVIKLKNKSAEIGLGVAPKKPTTVESKVSKSNKSVETQLPSIKSSSKCVSVNSKKEDKKSEFLFSCEICNVGASSDTVMNAHIKGKKHLKNLLKLHQETGAKKAHDSVEKHKAETVGGLKKVIGDKDKESTGETQVVDSESIGSVVDDMEVDMVR